MSETRGRLSPPSFLRKCQGKEENAQVVRASSFHTNTTALVNNEWRFIVAPSSQQLLLPMPTPSRLDYLSESGAEGTIIPYRFTIVLTKESDLSKSQNEEELSEEELNEEELGGEEFFFVNKNEEELIEEELIEEEFTYRLFSHT